MSNLSKIIALGNRNRIQLEEKSKDPHPYKIQSMNSDQIWFFFLVFQFGHCSRCFDSQPSLRFRSDSYLPEQIVSLKTNSTCLCVLLAPRTCTNCAPVAICIACAASSAYGQWPNIQNQPWTRFDRDYSTDPTSRTLCRIQSTIRRTGPTMRGKFAGKRMRRNA